MDRVNGADWVDIGGGRRGFRSQSLVDGVSGTEVTAPWLNAVQENLMKVIEEAGLEGDIDNWDLLWLALKASRVIDTHVVKTIGSAGDFATFQDAFEWATRYRIAPGYSLTFLVAAEDFGLDGAAETAIFSHPDGSRIHLIAADLLAAFPAQSAWAANGGGAGNRATDLAANKALAESVFATRVYCENGARASVVGNLGTFKNIAFLGDGSPVDGLVMTGGFSAVEAVVSLGFGVKNFAFQSAQSSVKNVVGAGGEHGLICISGAHLTCASGYIAGFNASLDGVTAAQMCAVYCTGGNVYAGGCAQYGVHADANAGITAGAASSSRNNTQGSFVATGQSRLTAIGSTSIGAPSVGYYSNGNSHLEINNCTASGTTFYLANRGSSIDAGGGNVGASSPAVNTVGNENSYIRQ